VLLGKGAKLMASSLSTHPLLLEFLQSHGNQYLSWLHNIQLNNFRQVRYCVRRFYTVNFIVSYIIVVLFGNACISADLFLI